MRLVKLLLVVSLVSGLGRAPAKAQETNQDQGGTKKPPGIKWINGPAEANLGGVANVKVPEGCIFAAGKDARRLLERAGNPTSGNELGLLLQTNSNWFVLFEFSDTGYIKDDDKDKLDADAILKSIREGNDRANKEREKMGAAVLTVTGWEQPPKYNPETHNLEWAIRGESEGKPVVNYNTRLLGRKGVMEANLVVDPDKLAATMPAYSAILKDYEFKTGERYAEYRQGDKIAKYGLAALVTGGAAVLAFKTGLFAYVLLFAKKLWVVIVAGLAAVVNFFKRLINGGKRKPTAE